MTRLAIDRRHIAFTPTSRVSRRRRAYTLPGALLLLTVFAAGIADKLTTARDATGRGLFSIWRAARHYGQMGPYRAPIIFLLMNSVIIMLAIWLSYSPCRDATSARHIKARIA